MSTHAYFTTPIYYVNDRPHIGHAYTTVLTDALARWARLLDPTREVYFLTGTDEHGQKVEQAARKRGVTPQAHCDELHQAFKSLWPELHIANSDFIRTTEPRHVDVVQQALQQLYDRGEIYAKPFAGWYSVSEERFFTEKELVDGKDPISGNAVEWLEEQNWFFRMGQYRGRLVAHLEAHPDFIQPDFRRNEVLGFLRNDLEDLCISRPKARLAWGIPIPFAPDYVTYVWFDALLNYLTGIGYPDTPGWERWWAESTHVLGKDILTTHSVYWTTMLMALGVPLPKRIIAHGWWLSPSAGKEAEKMSKSKGNVVSPLGMKDKYGVEVFRYFLLRDMSVGQDASFSEEALVQRNNTELANDLGNLLSRIVALVEKSFGGVVPEYVERPSQAADQRLRAAALELVEGGYRTHQLIEACLGLVRELNKLVTDTAPFKLVRDDPAAAGHIVRTVLDGLAAVGKWLSPVMPERMAELQRRIGAVDGHVIGGTAVIRGESLFPRFELEAPEAAPEPPKPAKAKKAEAQKGPKAVISYEDFAKLDLRVAQVEAAERVEGSDKLLRVTLDLGTEKRQVVAGIAKAYGPEELTGKLVVMVANLAPRTLFGLESQGMILAAHDSSRLFVIGPDGFAAAGAEVS